MGQQLFKVHLNLNDNTIVNSNTISSDEFKDDISFFFPLKTSSDPTINSLESINDQQNSSFQMEYIKQIQTHLFRLTKSIPWEEMNTEINEKFIENIFTLISKQNEKILEEKKNHLIYQQQLQTSLLTKTQNDNNINLSILSHSSEDKTKQLSYFAIQSLTSILLILIKSAEKTDRTIIHQILTLTSQLSEQLPMKCLSSTNHFLSKSLEPLTNYIQELSLSPDPILSKQTIQILLSFSIAKGSFKDILSLLNKLIFNPIDIYHAQGLVIQMNNNLTEIINEEKEFNSLTYLKSIHSYPNSELIQLNEELFTGQFLSSIILSHIDIENELNLLTKQYKFNSISCEFHSNTFKDLFYIIGQLIESNDIISLQILNVCLRLFTTHLQFLSDMNFNRSDLNKYVTDEELINWFNLLLKLINNQNSEQIIKAIIYVINLQSISLIEKLSFIHRYIIENKYPMLIKGLLIELNQNEILTNWIEILCKEENLEMLYSFIDLYFEREEEQKNQIQEILFSFQSILLNQLIHQCEKKTFNNNELQLSSLINQYLIYIFKTCMKTKSVTNDLFNSILIGLCLLTETKKIFLYEVIQPIFISILPLLAEYFLQNSNNEFISCLIGKMCHVLIIGLPQDSLEMKHVNLFKLPIFTGGCVIKKNDDLLKSNLAVYTQFQLMDDIQDDTDFLMSVYNNTNEGAQLISKLKLSIKDKQRVLQKSIEQQANDACAAIFAVYIKHYRRINLAKSELLRTDQHKPCKELLTIYEYANRIQTVFATIKGQGGDCNEFYKQIKMKTLFLLLSVKESDLIPIVKEELPSIVVDVKPKKEFNFQRQRSRWSKARHILKLLQNLFQACIRFKKFMLEKQQTSKQNYDYEILLNRSLDHFIYGDFYKSSTSITNEEKQLEIDELEKCLHRQHQRSMIRLITYQFIRTFIQNLLNLKNNDESLRIFSIYLPYLRKSDFEWSYFDNIQASNTQLKTEISSTYYSIIKLLLSFSVQSNNFIEIIFYLLSFSYESIDISHLYHHQITERLFLSFVSLINTSKDNSSLYLKFTAFNWFRLFVFKLSENIEIEILRKTSNEILQQQQNFVFNTFIFNEIKSFKEILSKTSEDEKRNSLKDISLNWFYQTNESMMINELYINQYLAFLIRSMHFYKHILSICSTIDYLEEFLHIYYHSQSNNITRLLTIKILRYLIPYIPDNIDGKSRNLIETFLIDILNSIGEKSTSQEILAELIYLYRTIMSMDSSWQIKANEFVFNSIKSHLNIKSIERNHINEMKILLASLAILGGYIQSYRLGSIVKIESNEESLLALIIEINSEENLYLIQYLQTNQIESVSIDKLRLEIDVPPPNLSDSNDSILDILGDFIQIDTSINESLLLLQLKRHSLSVLSHLLNNKNLIETFINKPYASVLAKLCLSNTTHRQLSDLRVFNKQHLEQYYLSLDTTKDIVSTNDQETSLSINWKRREMNREQTIIDALSIPIDGWKPYACEDEIEFFKQGRIGNGEISIVPMPRGTVDMQTIEECGNKHRFRGRIAPTYENTRASFPTFGVENIQLSEGNWYYCVRLPVGGVIQIGWATNGFSPSGGCGVGDDRYSWSYDGSRGVLFCEQGYYGQFDDIRWNENDICGCGIEINGEKTKIKYWLNGKLLGPAFVHNANIPLTSTKCDLLPNGLTTTYYPAVTLQWAGDPLRSCELIFSPEDMQDCPLPNGYKPLLLPKLVHTENSIVDYPFHAYLIGDNPQDFLLTKRTKPSVNLLRDFVHEYHLETSFSLDDHYLILPDKSDGFLLSLDNNEVSSLTISFDFQILSPGNQLDFSLFKFNSEEISWNQTDEKQQCVIIFLSKKRQIKIYINNQCQILNDAFQYETIKTFNLQILPGISARFHNLAIWKYALSEEDISRLFTYGLFYIVNDYQQLKDYRKRVNTISFSKNQQEFVNELLLPLNEPFTEEIWEKKKKQADDNEFKYFKSHEEKDYSTIDLFDNTTYLILNKSNEEWSTYTLVLDISIPHWPIITEKLTLIDFNSKSELYLTQNGKLHLENSECDLIIIPTEYFRLFISVHEQSIQIYINNILQIDRKIDDDRFHIKSNRIDLFKEKNPTSEKTFRISFKSITYLNRAISIDQLQSPTLIAPPFEIFGPSLIAIGYKKNWIQSAIEQNQTKDIAIILREQKQQFIKTDLDNERKRYLKVFSKLNPSIDSEVLKGIINCSKFDTNEQIIDLSQRLLPYLISSQSSNQSLDQPNFGINWFAQSIEDLNISSNLVQWVQDEKSSVENEDNIYQLLDLTQSKTKKNQKSIQYSLQNLSSKKLFQSRIAIEYGLITIYARSTIFNMLKVWSYDGSILFPFEKFGDYTLLKLLDYTQSDKNEILDRIYLLIKSILKTEIKQLIEHELQSKTPLFSYLQKEIISQSIQFLVKPSLFNQNLDQEIMINQQQPNINFLLKILKLFIELLTDKSLIKQHQIDLIIPILFPTSLINLIFDLFLLVPTHQSKISILHLFTTLIRLSDTFKFNHHIEQFFFRLLIELTSKDNGSRNPLQVPLTDLIFLLLTKQKKSIEDFQLKFSENIQDLFTTIDIINSWIDPTKQKSLPEIIFKESNEILGEDWKLNEDDFKKSNHQFNIIADQDLIHLMNNSSLLNDSFSVFIQTLPIESEPNPIFYKTYVSLSNIPADCIQIRARFFYLLNKFIESNLSMVDFSLPPEQSILTDQIRMIKLYLLSSTKFQLFGESLDKTETGSNNDWCIVNFDTVKASTDTENSENTMFYQAYQQLHTNAHITFRRANEQLWHAQYLGMHSTDQGGPYRDSITCICSDICSTRLPLFILCPNGRTNSGLNRDCWIPNVFPPNKIIGNKFQKQYRFVGQLMGMAIRKKHYLDLKFPILLWKELLKEQITIEDIEAIDIQSFTIINEMEKNIEQIKSIDVDHDIDSLFSNIMSELRFDVVSSSGQTYELIPGGTEIPITATNFKQYCSCYRQYRLNEFSRQIDFIRQGLYSIIPCYYLSLFTTNELEESVCGKGRIDVELLKRNTSYGGDYSQDSPPIQRFWTVLNDMFNEEQKKLLLVFAWGRSTLPSRDEDFHGRFTISTFDVYNGDVDKTLPRSHTCFFTIDLPAYSTTEIMFERLNYAITCCSSIDGDGNMNDAPTLGHFDSDDSSNEL